MLFTILFAVLLGFSILLLMFLIVKLAENEWVEAIIVGLGLLICIGGIYAISVTDSTRAINNATVNVEYAQVNKVGDNLIELDGETYSGKNDDVSKIYPVDLKQFKVGDIVQVKILQGDLSNYLIGLKKIK